MKKCNAPYFNDPNKICGNPVWGGGYCKAHQYFRTDKNDFKSSNKLLDHYRKSFAGYDDNGILKTNHLEAFLEATTDDLHQDSIKYHPEKIVSPTVQNKIKRTPLRKRIKKSNHVEIYMKFFGYCKDDVIICERCNNKATDIHHIHGRGKDKNVIENLIALCRECHTLCHNNKDINCRGEVVHLNNVLKELKNRKDKI